MRTSKTAKTSKIKTPAVEIEPEAVEIKVKATVVPVKYRKQYGKAGNCGDEMAETLKVFLTDSEDKQAALIEIGDANGVDVMERWGSRNFGMQRMNLGNVLRGHLKHGKDVVIGDDTIKGEVAE